MRVAVVGLGFMGATHAQAWTSVAGAELWAVVSGSERKLSGDLRESQGNLSTGGGQLDFSNVTKYRTYEEALDDADTDAVDLCIPTDRHVDYAIRALRSGKHVLLEKPLALTAALAERVAEEAERCGRVLMVAHVLRFMPAYVMARERLAQLGPVRSAAFRRRCAAPAWSEWLNDAARSGGGAFDLLIHDADYVRWLFGMPQAIQASGVMDAPRGIDLVYAGLDYPGLSVSISGGWHGASAYPFSMEFNIVCEGGVLELAGGALTEYRMAGAPEKIALPDKDAFPAELEHFHECAAANHASAVCPVRESVDAVWLMEQILRKRAESAILGR